MRLVFRNSNRSRAKAAEEEAAAERLGAVPLPARFPAAAAAADRMPGWEEATSGYNLLYLHYACLKIMARGAGTGVAGETAPGSVSKPSRTAIHFEADLIIRTTEVLAGTGIHPDHRALTDKIGYVDYQTGFQLGVFAHVAYRGALDARRAVQHLQLHGIG